MNAPHPAIAKPAKRGASWVPWLAACAMLVLLYGVLFPSVGHREPAKVTQAFNDVSQIRAALKAYYSEYGAPPSGDHISIINALLGGNPRNIVFIEFHPRQKSPEGHFLDPWGTPYRIDASQPTDPKAFSAGKNKIDEPDKPESDDVRSWR